MCQYDVACYGVVIFTVKNWLICLLEHKSPELLKAAPKNLLSKPVPL